MKGARYEVLRIRNFLQHSPDQITEIRSEYTIRNNGDKGLQDIFILSSNFLTNLHVVDSENVEYPLMTNSDTEKLLEFQSKDDEAYRDLLRKVQKREKYLIWIKIPPNRKMEPDETRLIYLDYEAKIPSKPDLGLLDKMKQYFRIRNKPILLHIEHENQFSVFFTLQKPKDYHIKPSDVCDVDRGTVISTRDGVDLPYRYDETDAGLTLYIKPNSNIVLSYSPHVKPSVMMFPVFSILALILFAGFLSAIPYMLDVDLPGLISGTVPSLPVLQLQTIHDHRIELSIFVISSSLVIPQLIPNVAIRNKKSALYFVPIVLVLPAFLF